MANAILIDNRSSEYRMKNFETFQRSECYIEYGEEEEEEGEEGEENSHNNDDNGVDNKNSNDNVGYVDEDLGDRNIGDKHEDNDCVNGDDNCEDVNYGLLSLAHPRFLPFY
ncbi:Hypothetical predicted protein [Octopus vulgaris]|uniref:Uncharacterized protein n=1 Tax=Octopus vulgaris TaxID=6645 RepID=A0AA36FFJ8_OCTVU|nr:Hypothetical predicted protein [Octopus vulgaris]